MEDYFQNYKEKNVDEITFTEHHDIYDGINTNLKTLDVLKYYNFYKKMKEKYNYKFNFGIEIGLQPDVHEKIRIITSSYPLRFASQESYVDWNDFKNCITDSYEYQLEENKFDMNGVYSRWDENPYKSELGLDGKTK